MSHKPTCSFRAQHQVDGLFGLGEGGEDFLPFILTSHHIHKQGTFFLTIYFPKSFYKNCRSDDVQETIRYLETRPATYEDVSVTETRTVEGQTGYQHWYLSRLHLLPKSGSGAQAVKWVPRLQTDLLLASNAAIKNTRSFRYARSIGLHEKPGYLSQYSD
jgi:hypothetical protein